MGYGESHSVINQLTYFVLYLLIYFFIDLLTRISCNNKIRCFNINIPSINVFWFTIIQIIIESWSQTCVKYFSVTTSLSILTCKTWSTDIIFGLSVGLTTWIRLSINFTFKWPGLIFFVFSCVVNFVVSIIAISSVSSGFNFFGWNNSYNFAAMFSTPFKTTRTSESVSVLIKIKVWILVFWLIKNTSYTILIILSVLA